MTNQNHTPTPWQLDAGTGNILGPRDGCSHAIIATMPVWWPGKAPGEHASQDVQAANAALIVHAVNSHQALIDALQVIHDSTFTTKMLFGHLSPGLVEALDHKIKIASAVLASAQEEKQ